MLNNNIDNVPDNTIAILGYTADKTFDSIKSLKGNVQRDWFEKNYYFCLPLVMANQFGIGYFSLNDVVLRWNGESGPEAVTIKSDKVDENIYGSNKQKVFSMLGNGVVTIQHDFLIKTPPNVNLYVTQPPNSFIPGLHTMSGLVESDNLTRDFTITLKISVPNIDIIIKKGDMLACLLPVPRFFPDSFEIKDARDIFDLNSLKKSIELLDKYVEKDSTLYKNGGLFNSENKDFRDLSIYYRGEDPFGNKFKTHQKKPLK